MTATYLDYAATTPMREEVREAMAPFLDDAFGNPSSTHAWGRAAAAALADARDEVAAALGARFGEIVFTRGGTEADNLAVLGRVRRLRADGHTPTVAVSAVEHKAVLDAARHATARGAGRLVALDVSPAGEVDADGLAAALQRPPAVVSVMWVNNETGLVLGVDAVAEAVAEAGGTFHTDAVQAAGKLPVRVDRLPVDLLTVTGHKIYGPKGTGALFVRGGVELLPLLYGGGQEQGLRPGTEDVAGAVGLATALRLAVEERAGEARRLEALRSLLEREAAANIEGLRVHGSEGRRAPHIVSFGVEGVRAEGLLMALDLEGIAASGGAACQSGGRQGSHVLEALYGAEPDVAAVRFSLGRGTTESDVRRAVETLAAVVARLRAGAGS